MFPCDRVSTFLSIGVYSRHSRLTVLICAYLRKSVASPVFMYCLLCASVSPWWVFLLRITKPTSWPPVRGRYRTYSCVWEKQEKSIRAAWSRRNEVIVGGS